jgi:uncharacterized protein
VPSQVKELPSIIKEEAEKSDCCLHCGDFTSFTIFKKLSQWTKTYGVCGNMDDMAIRKNLPLKQILKLEEVTIALTHGSGHPQNLIYRINNEFSNKMSAIDMLIFGHSHCALNEERCGKIYLNPGSPTDTIFAAKRSYGILNIQGKKIEREIITIE